MASAVSAGMGDIPARKLFLLSCISLVVTAMTFAIRAGILTQLSEEFTLSDTQLGFVNAMAFLGFPVAMVLLGYLYNQLGAKLIMVLAFVGHLLGLVLTITAGGFVGLLVSTFFIGFANGAVEAACNPMIADMYEDNKTTMLNKFHVWFPGGIVIGALVSAAMTKMGMGWQMQIGIMILPTLVYGYMVFTTLFPERVKNASVKPVELVLLVAVLGLMILLGLGDLNEALAFVGTSMGKIVVLIAIFALLAILLKTRRATGRDIALLFVIMGLMTLTATSELGTQQWVERILGASGANSMVILAMVTGLMAVGRYFAGPIVHRLNPIGVLLMSAILTSLGIFLMSIVTGGLVYLAAIVFALGVCYFWPTMIGYCGENIARTGALGLSLVGAAGMYALTFWNPIIGGWIDAARQKANDAGVEGAAADVVAGQAALSNLVYFPLVLIVCFFVLWLIRGWVKSTAGDGDIVPETAPAE